MHFAIITNMQIKENVELAPYTTFKVGGPARFFAEVKSEEDLIGALDFAKQNQARVFFLSGGSNVLFSDEGFDGLVILNKIASKINFRKSFWRNIVSADAGIELKRFLEFLQMAGLSGYEKLYGVPGSLSGAIRGNAGAFGVEIKDHLLSVRALNTQTLERKVFKKKELNFAYRHSFFKENPEWFVLSADFALKASDAEEIKSKMEKILQEREKRQLQNIKSVGSFFKNPKAPKEVQELFEKEKGVAAREGRVPAGWLIEKVGLKGKRLAYARVSDSSANYLINDGFAKSKDILELAELVKSEVKEKFGILLEEEVHVVR